MKAAFHTCRSEEAQGELLLEGENWNLSGSLAHFTTHTAGGGRKPASELEVLALSPPDPREDSLLPGLPRGCCPRCGDRPLPPAPALLPTVPSQERQLCILTFVHLGSCLSSAIPRLRRSDSLSDFLLLA